MLAKLVRQDKERQEKKRHTDWEKINKYVFVFRWHIFLCRKSKQIHYKNLPKLMRNYSKVVEYKINIQQSTVLYIPAVNKRI